MMHDSVSRVALRITILKSVTDETNMTGARGVSVRQSTTATVRPWSLVPYESSTNVRKLRVAYHKLAIVNFLHE